jgi:GR25 family glycosyltransferase involved in LPS biosynthesis
MLFGEKASTLPWPEQDMLFIEDFVYNFGIREEISIAGYYSTSPERQEAGRRACFGLSMDRHAPGASQALARHNQIYYARPGHLILPSLRTWPLPFRPLDGGNAMNPSVAIWNNSVYVLVRGVNYEVTEAGHYTTPANGPIETRNYLVRLNADLHPEAWSEILPPFDLPPRRYPLVKGFEDARLFVWGNALWCSSTIRELSEEGWCEIVLARIDHPLTDACALTNWRVLKPEGPQLHQKNWMPQVREGSLRFIYSVDPTRIVDEQARTVGETTPPAALDHVRGGSQAVDFDGGWLTVTHEVSHSAGKPVYLHRFLWFDKSDALRRATQPFYFVKLGIEFAAGLAWHPDGQNLIVSFGVRDAEAWIGMVSASDLRVALNECKPDDVGNAAQPRREAPVRPFAAASLAAQSEADRPAKSLPKMYCVVCPQLSDRRTAAEAHFRKRGLNVELFAGVHGPTWGLTTTKLRADGRRMSAGSVGLLLSHWLLWRVAVCRDDEEVLIFEDDVILGKNFETEFRRSYAQLPPDWQFAFVGSLGQHLHEPVEGRVSVVRYPYGTHAYLVKKSVLPTLIETNQEVRTHLDLQLIENTLPRLKCYTFTPPLVSQRMRTGE